MRKTFTTWNEAHGRHEMLPAQLRAIRMDMGVNMVAMAHLLEAHTTSRISRNKYRLWERPRAEGEWQFIPRHIADAAEKLYKAFWDFVGELVESGGPLVLIHRNDMFDEAALPLPWGITVENYNQAIGKAWGILTERGQAVELVSFSTDPEDRYAPESVHPHHPPVHKPPLENVGSEELPAVRELKSFVSWDRTSLGPKGK